MPFNPANAINAAVVAGGTGGIAWHNSVANEHNRLRTFEPPSGAVLTADAAANTSTALANVAGLSFPLVANDRYRFTFYALYSTAATTTGIRLGVTCPAGVIAGRVIINGITLTDGTAAEFEGSLTFSGDSVMSLAVGTANQPYLALVEGLIIPTAAGNLQLQAASEVAGSGVTLRNGSHGQLHRVG